MLTKKDRGLDFSNAHGRGLSLRHLSFLWCRGIASENGHTVPVVANHANKSGQSSAGENGQSKATSDYGKMPKPGGLSGVANTHVVFSFQKFRGIKRRSPLNGRRLCIFL